MRSRSASLSYLSSSLSFSRFSSLSRSLSLLLLSCLLSGVSGLSCSLVGLLSLVVALSFLSSATSAKFKKAKLLNKLFQKGRGEKTKIVMALRIMSIQKNEKRITYYSSKCQ